jgi:hypothetical protein
MKLTEIIIAVICLILLRAFRLNFGWESATGDSSDRYNVGIATIAGMLMVTIPLLISYIWAPSGSAPAAYLETIYNCLGFVLFLTTGALVLAYYANLVVSGKEHVDAGKALGSLCIINSALFLTDAVLAIKQGVNS